MKKYIIPLFLFSSFVLGATDCTVINDSNQIYLCSQEKKKENDMQLNLTYKQLISKIKQTYAGHDELKENYLDTIKKSQQTWLRFRDSNCEVYAFQIEQSSQAHETTTNECVADMSKKRIEELAKFIGDI
jgi:uncharacterized protein YecT (DUF1311 family)